jgi:hypothetical protein
VDHTFIILKYLYKNNIKGDYHSVIDAYKGKDTPGKQELLNILNELNQLEYLEIEATGWVGFVGIAANKENAEPGSIRDYKARIKRKGEAYIDSKVYHFGKWIIRKNSFIAVVFIPVIIAVIIYLVTR